MINQVKTIVVTVAAEKGGVGKSTAAVNIAAYCLNLGMKVLLIDADKQRNAANWATQRNARDNLKKIYCIEKLGSDLTHVIRTDAAKKGEDGKPLYDIIIVDTPGVEGKELRCAAITSHYFLTFFKTNAFDAWTAPTVASVVEEINSVRDSNPLKCFVTASMVTTHPKKQPKQMERFAKLAQRQLKDFTLTKTILHSRDAFAEAVGYGMGVTEYAPDSVAAQELTNLVKEAINVG